MARILVVTSEMAGRVRISRELVRRLERSGHQAVVGGPVVPDDADGYLHLPLGDEPEPGRHASAADVAAALDIAGLTRVLAADEPDLVLVDQELPVHVMAAWATGAPVGLWTSMMSVWKRRGVPPLHTPIVPGRGFSGSSLGIELAWVRFRLGRIYGRMQRVVMPERVNRVAVLREVADQTSFPFAEHISLHDWLLPVTFRGLPVLVFNLADLEFPHRPRPGVTYVGPLPDADPGRPGEPALAEVLARRAAGEVEALIYGGFGAWHRGDDSQFVRHVIDAVGTTPSWQLVLGLGGRRDPTDFGSVPENVLLLPWAPQRTVLASADLSIHHGGIGSVNDCIVEAVPMIVYPFTFLDQPGNGARVSFHGLGEVGSRHEEGPTQIASRIERMLEDPGPQAAVRRFAERVEHADSVAVEEVEAMLDSAPRRHHSA